MGQETSSDIYEKRDAISDPNFRESETGSRRYFKDGILRRDDGSITILEEERTEYYKQMARGRRRGRRVVGPFLEWWKDGLLHNEKGPAIQRIDWRGDREEWWVDGKRHKTGNEPAVVVYNVGGDIIRQEWWVDGKRHRENGNPAVVHADGWYDYKEWWVDGYIHRENGPAYLSENEEIWFRWGVRHREDGPAEITKYRGKVSELWYMEGQLLDTPLLRQQKKSSPRFYSIIGRMAGRRLSKSSDKGGGSPTSSCSISPPLSTNISANTSPFSSPVNSPRSIPPSPLASPRDCADPPTTPRERNKVFWNKTDDKVILKDKDRRSQLSASKSMDMIDSLSRSNISREKVRFGPLGQDCNSPRKNIKGMGKSMTEVR